MTLQHSVMALTRQNKSLFFDMFAWKNIKGEKRSLQLYFLAASFIGNPIRFESECMFIMLS